MADDSMRSEERPCSLDYMLKLCDVGRFRLDGCMYFRSWQCL